MFGNKLFDLWCSGYFEGGKDIGIENMKLVWVDKICVNGLKFVDVCCGLVGVECLKWLLMWGEFFDFCKLLINVDVVLYEVIE